MRTRNGAYLAFAWPAASEDAGCEAAAWRRRLAAAGGWSNALRADGLEIWARGGDLTLHRIAPGLTVIGDLHVQPGEDRAPSARPWPEPSAASRDLARRSWGRYIALIAPGPEAAPWVFRDPSGALDALTWRAGHLAAVARDIAELPGGLAPPALALDWDAIT